MVDGGGLAEEIRGLAGVRVIWVAAAKGEVTIEVEPAEKRASRQRCGWRAESQDRIWLAVSDSRGVRSTFPHSDARRALDSR